MVATTRSSKRKASEELPLSPLPINKRVRSAEIPKPAPPTNGLNIAKDSPDRVFEVTVGKGKGKKIFAVTAETLRKSPMLGASVKSWTQEYDAGKILLPEDTPEAFDAAIKFLTSNVIPPCLVNSSHPGSPKAIATLYIFADRYLLGDLMEQVEECIEDTANSNKCTCVEIVYEILETLPASTPGLDMLLEQTMQMVFQDMTEDEAERVKELVASSGEFASVALQGSMSNSKALMEERDDALNEVTTTTNTLKTTKTALDKSEEENAELEERVEELEEDDGGAENVQAELDAEEAAHEQTKRVLRRLEFNVDLVQQQIDRAVLREQEMEKLFHQYRRGEKTLEQVAYLFGSADEE